MLTKLKTYTKMHVPFGDTKNEPYEVTRATAYCSDCKRRIHLTESYAMYPGLWVHAKLSDLGPHYQVLHRAEIPQKDTK